MNDGMRLGLIGALAAVITPFAARVQALPDVIDLSSIPTGSGLLSLALTSYGAARRFDPDRLGRLALGGTVFAGLGTALVISVLLLADVLF